MEHDELRPGLPGDARRMVEHPDRHVELFSAFGVSHEAGDRRMDGQGDVMLRGELTELPGKLVVHPEPSLEIDLAGGEPAGEQRVDRCARRVAARHARRAVVQVTRH